MDSRFLGVEILSWIGVGAAFCYLVIFTIFSWYRYQEEKLHKELEKKIYDFKHVGGVTQAVLEGQIRATREEHRPKLESIERKKRFLLDITPFLKK